ncbi:hypothetical protein HBI56_242610 [Parastagonospora nodorum]|nr:hypothetical protein HBH96_248560 [Parastagonospora nodorum]KAH5045827.1 hypothetical protein HBI73_251430 [Parastagonospora nodorum]KAH5088028.1 hypothetical protein HBH72_251200 [Parastagonospora nodorum]KAH5165925.1 hypothetical protein HBH68_244960 [Parastagonospora nodorum]KAH5241944.1 hypothetical protein HBI70_246080 [Parastagonospora nodorum]
MTPGRWIPKRTARGGHESGFARPVGIELHICCSVQLSFKSSSAIITPGRWIPKRTVRGGHKSGFVGLVGIEPQIHRFVLQLPGAGNGATLSSGVTL